MVILVSLSTDYLYSFHSSKKIKLGTGLELCERTVHVIRNMPHMNLSINEMHNFAEKTIILMALKAVQSFASPTIMQSPIVQATAGLL